MGLEIDPQVLEELAPLMAAAPGPPTVGDVAARRENTRRLYRPGSGRASARRRD